MKFKLFKVSGYEEAINSLRMSKGKFFSWEKAQKIQHLVHCVTDHRGFVANDLQYQYNIKTIQADDTDLQHTGQKGELSGHYRQDMEEFFRLLSLVLDNAMGTHKHHTLMKYIDVSFFTLGLHRGAQDDLDAHAMGFNNRITRYSTRLAEINDVELSEWYQDKVIPLHSAMEHVGHDLPGQIEIGENVFKYTPFGYVLERFADMSPKSGLYKDVHRAGMPLGMESHAIWKTDLFNLRYIYKMRSKLTKANPELKEGMEQLADQIEELIPVFGQVFRMEFTDTGEWEHMNKVRTVTREEYELIKRIKKEQEAEDEIIEE